jgi:hypothetical protein
VAHATGDDPPPSALAEKLANELLHALRPGDMRPEALQDVLQLLQGLAEISLDETEWVLGQLDRDQLRRAFTFELWNRD